MTFPQEPIGAEAAIYWHIRQIDHHDNQASMADAIDYIDSAKYHGEQCKLHQERLAILEREFPETSLLVRKSIEHEDNQESE